MKFKITLCSMVICFFIFTFFIFCSLLMLCSVLVPPRGLDLGGGGCSDHPDQDESRSGLFIIYYFVPPFSRFSLGEIKLTLSQSVKPSCCRLHLFRHGYTGDPERLKRFKKNLSFKNLLLEVLTRCRSLHPNKCWLSLIHI